MQDKGTQVLFSLWLLLALNRADVSNSDGADQLSIARNMIMYFFITRTKYSNINSFSSNYLHNSLNSHYLDHIPATFGSNALQLICLLY